MVKMTPYENLITRKLTGKLQLVLDTDDERVIEFGEIEIPYVIHVTSYIPEQHVEAPDATE